MEGIAPVAALPGFRLTVCRPQRKRRAPMTFAIRNLDHVVVCVSDLERALKFYTEVLGCREERRVERIGLVQLRAGASMIDLQRVNPGPEESEQVAPPRNRSEERRVGKEWGRTCRSRGAPDTYKKKQHTRNGRSKKQQ